MEYVTVIISYRKSGSSNVRTWLQEPYGLFCLGFHLMCVLVSLITTNSISTFGPVSKQKEQHGSSCNFSEREGERERRGLGEGGGSKVVWKLQNSKFLLMLHLF